MASTARHQDVLGGYDIARTSWPRSTLPDFDIKLNELDDATAFAEWAKLPNFQTVSAEEFLDIVQL
ncbi:MAG: hypothetical protein ACLSVD_10260 [Eggerthellaceae bacterium]